MIPLWYNIYIEWENCATHVRCETKFRTNPTNRGKTNVKQQQSTTTATEQPVNGQANTTTIIPDPTLVHTVRFYAGKYKKQILIATGAAVAITGAALVYKYNVGAKLKSIFSTVDPVVPTE